MGVGAMAEGLPSGSWKGCFSLGILHLAPAAVNRTTHRNHGNRNAVSEGGGKDGMFLFERPVCDFSTLRLPVVPAA